jgi:crotonobetainyl-CoA:carnitine CoA-transferase CaiB-like acyl-CoA transferase
VIGRADMIDDPRYRTNQDRVRHKDAVNGAVAEWIGARKRDEVMEIFEREEITASPIYDPRDMEHDPHFIERGVIVEVPDEDIGSAPMHNIVPCFSETPGTFRHAAPRIGADTDTILDAIGIDAATRLRLKASGVIGGGKEQT